MLTRENQRWVALATVLTFLWVFQVSAFSPDPSGKIQSGNDGTVAKISSDEDTAGAVEKISEKSGKKEKKPFPWLLVTAGVVLAGAAAYYFLVYQKKEFKLTTEKGIGVSGSPESGVSGHKRGSKVNYSYTLAPGYRSLKVTLDGADVAASGTVSMKKDHTLVAVAVKDYVLSVTTDTGVVGTPLTGTYSYASGETVNYNYSLQPGFSNLQVKLDGVTVSSSGTITMNSDHSLSAATMHGLQLEWLMNGNAQDTSGWGRHGTASNMTPTTDHKGAANLAYSFNGTNSYIEHPGFDIHENKHFTISLWISIPAATVPQRYILRNREAHIYQRGSTIYFLPNTGSSTNCEIPLNTWTHIAVTYDNAVARIYRNGTLANSYNSASNFLPAEKLRVGGTSGEYFLGYLDDLRIYNHTMTDAEIQTLAGM